MNKKSLILVAALVIALVGCNKEKEEANVPVVGEQQAQVAAPAEQNAHAGMQQQAPAVETPAPAASAAPAAPEAPVVTKSTLEMSNESAPAAPVAPVAPEAPAK